MQKLRPSQRKVLLGVVQKIAKDPSLGEQRVEEWEQYYLYDFQDNYGRYRLTYFWNGSLLRFCSLDLIAIKI